MSTRAARRPVPSRPRTHRTPLRVVEGEGGSTRKKTKRRSPLPVVLLVVLTVFGVAALQAWVGQDGLHAARLEREVQQEQERLTLLRAQVAQLGSPKRLREEAHRLGLVPAAEPQFLRVQVPVASDSPGTAAEGIAAPAP